MSFLMRTQPEVQMIAQLNDLASDQRQLARDAAQQSQQAPQKPSKIKNLVSMLEREKKRGLFRGK